MPRPRKPFYILLSGVLTITCLVFTGCNPPKTAQDDSNTSTESTKSETSNNVTGPATEESPTGDATPKDPTDSNANASETTTTNTNTASSPAGPLVIDGSLDSVDWRSLIGKEVTVSGRLVIVDTYDLIRRGQVKIARERLFIPTSTIDPNDADPEGTSFEGGSNVAQVVRTKKFNEAATITLDDGPADQNIFPPALFPGLGKSYPTVRTGSVINGVSGKLVRAGRNILLVPYRPLNWQPANRPARPDVGDAELTVASFNVLNYFTTIDDGRNQARGADSKTEFNRQEAKIVSAIIEMDADVIGLMELENNIASERQLVAALNKAVGSKVYKGSGLPAGFQNAPGGKNAIRVGIIYRSDRVVPVGDVDMIVDDAFASARTPIVRSFRARENSDGKRKPFTLVVNHFKSKGGSDRAEEVNKDKGDGQGAYNAARRAQALAICKYIDKRKQSESAPRVLVIGDLNAYEQEDPIDALRAKGLVNLTERSASKAVGRSSVTEHYSFVYYGQAGSLDHAMATQSLADDVTGIGTWHINSDEPRFLDYNQEFNPKPLYKPDPFRSSDHDPILIGIGN